MPPPVLEAREVRKAFFGNPVLKGVSIALEPGRVHALLGPPGSKMIAHYPTQRFDGRAPLDTADFRGMASA